MIHIGIAGAGKIVPEFLAAAALVPSLSVDAIFARRDEPRRLLAEKFAIPRQYATYEQLLCDPSLDVIYIALLNQLHFSFAQQALAHGKHVILEKPLTVTLAQTDALIAQAASQHVFLFEAITNLYHPNMAEFKQLLPQVGTVKIVQLNYSQYSSRYDRFRAGESLPVFTPECAGGSLTDLGIYNIHLVTELFGAPQKVHYYPNMERGVDTSGILVLEYPSFRCVSVSAKDCKAPTCFSVQGDKGCLFSDAKPNQFEHFSLLRNDGAEESRALAHGEPRLYHELAAFAAHFSVGDSGFFAQRLAHSRVAMQVLDAAIADGGMNFSSDKKSEKTPF